MYYGLGLLGLTVAGGVMVGISPFTTLRWHITPKQGCVLCMCADACQQGIWIYFGHKKAPSEVEALMPGLTQDAEPDYLVAAKQQDVWILHTSPKKQHPHIFFFARHST